MQSREVFHLWLSRAKKCSDVSACFFRFRTDLKLHQPQPSLSCTDVHRVEVDGQPAFTAARFVRKPWFCGLAGVEGLSFSYSMEDFSYRTKYYLQFKRHFSTTSLVFVLFKWMIASYLQQHPTSYSTWEISTTADTSVLMLAG